MPKKQSEKNSAKENKKKEAKKPAAEPIKKEVVQPQPEAGAPVGERQETAYGVVTPTSLVSEMRTSYLDYAMSVIVSRALPDVRDGLKPVHRRILYAMWSLGLKPGAKFRKSATVVGEVLGKYHPHGDSAVYESMVRMAQDFSMRYRLVHGQGNFGCFTADTKVKLTDGRNLSFAELVAEAKTGKQNYTFSINKAGHIEVVAIQKPRLTRQNAEIMEVCLDNGEKIRCTLNHKFMLKGRGYKEAKDLKTGESLMPGYFRLSAKDDDPNVQGYAMIFQPVKDAWQFVHILADEWNITHHKYAVSFGRIRHHVDFNKLNNNPDNIKRMNWAEHWRTHYNYMAQKHSTDPEYRRKLATGRKNFWKNDAHRQAYAARLSARNLKNWKQPGYREKMQALLSDNTKAYLHSHPDAVQQIRERASKTFKRLWQLPEYRALFHDKIVKANQTRQTNNTGRKKFINICSQVLIKGQHIDKESYEELRVNNFGGKGYTSWDLGLTKYYDNDVNRVLYELNKNHKVTKVNFLNESADVYDLTIDENHNFLLSAGIFVHNSMDGDGAAAMRYTEAKLAAISEELLADLEKDTVDFIPNYDGSQKEPTVLPAKLPNLLLNGALGIAVGMATNIPPHNLNEVAQAVMHLVDNPDASVDDLLEFVKGPDFPTGGIIYDATEIKKVYATGRGGIVIRAKADIVEAKSGQNDIVITEIPYQVNKAELVTKIADLVKDKKIEGIKDLRDESDKDGVRVVVELKKDAYPKKILNSLFKHTSLQTTFHVNLIALVDGIQPKLLNLKMVLEEHIKHRVEVIRRRTQFELDKAKARAHILEGLMIALKNIDAVIKVIKASKDKDVAKVNLMKKFKLTEIQSVAILEMRLQQLANLEQQKIADELKEKLKLIKELEGILSSRKKVLDIIKADAQYLMDKYGDERRTKLVATSLKEFRQEDLVPNEPAVIVMTRDGYIKRLSPETFKVQGRGGKGVIGLTTKEEDIVEFFFTTTTHSDILFFTTRGRVFQLKAYDIPPASRTAKGQAIVNFLQLLSTEKVTSILPFDKLDKAGTQYLFMATQKGVVKKVAIAQFSNVRRSGLIAIKIKDDDTLIWTKPTSGKDHVMLITAQGQSIRFKESDVRPMGRNASGVTGVRLKKDDLVIGMAVIKTEVAIMKHYQLLTVAGLGFGKRSALNLYKVQGRGGSGIKTFKASKKTGQLVNAYVVNAVGMAEKDLIIISEHGQVIRLPFKSVPGLGRDTQGVRLMRLKEVDDKIANVTWV